MTAQMIVYNQFAGRLDEVDGKLIGATLVDDSYDPAVTDTTVDSITGEVSGTGFARGQFTGEWDTAALTARVAVDAWPTFDISATATPVTGVVTFYDDTGPDANKLISFIPYEEQTPVDGWVFQPLNGFARATQGGPIEGRLTAVEGRTVAGVPFVAGDVDADDLAAALAVSAGSAPAGVDLVPEVAGVADFAPLIAGGKTTGNAELTETLSEINLPTLPTTSEGSGFTVYLTSPLVSPGSLDDVSWTVEGGGDAFVVGSFDLGGLYVWRVEPDRALDSGFSWVLFPLTDGSGGGSAPVDAEVYDLTGETPGDLTLDMSAHPVGKATALVLMPIGDAQTLAIDPPVGPLYGHIDVLIFVSDGSVTAYAEHNVDLTIDSKELMSDGPQYVYAAFIALAGVDYMQLVPYGFNVAGGGGGGVVGSGMSTAHHFAKFADTSGSLLEDGGPAGGAASLDVGTGSGDVAAGDAPAAAITAHSADTDPHGDRAYAASLFAANDALVYKGVVDCSSNPNYPAADAGHAYKVSVAGKIGGASGVNVEVGDLLLCTVDSSSSGNQATVGANWDIIQVNLDGAVIGPASATDNRLVVADGTSGRLVKMPSTDVSVGQKLTNVTNPTSAQHAATMDYVDTADGLLVPKSLYDANTILAATTDNTPAAVTVAASRIVGRKASGDIGALTGAEILAILTGQNGADFSFNSHKLTNVTADTASTSAAVVGQVPYINTAIISTTTISNDATEQNAVSIALPTDLVAGDMVHLVAFGDRRNNSGSAVTYTHKLKLGTTTVLTQSAAQSLPSNNARSAWVLEAWVMVETTSAQRIAATYTGSGQNTNTWDAANAGASYVGSSTAAEDLTSAKSLIFTVQMGAADTNADFAVIGGALEIVKKR